MYRIQTLIQFTSLRYINYKNNIENIESTRSSTVAVSQCIHDYILFF